MASRAGPTAASPAVRRTGRWRRGCERGSARRACPSGFPASPGACQGPPGQRGRQASQGPAWVSPGKPDVRPPNAAACPGAAPPVPCPRCWSGSASGLRPRWRGPASSRHNLLHPRSFATWVAGAAFPRRLQCVGSAPRPVRCSRPGSFPGAQCPTEQGVRGPAPGQNWPGGMTAGHRARSISRQQVPGEPAHPWRAGVRLVMRGPDAGVWRLATSGRPGARRGPAVSRRTRG